MVAIRYRNKITTQRGGAKPLNTGHMRVLTVEIWLYG